MKALSKNSRFRPVVFLHVPKTAGTSLIQALLAMKPWAHTLTHEGNITPELLHSYASLSVDQRSDALIYGHAYHGIFQAFTDATLLTVVRDPEEQAVSNYLHILRSPDTHLYQDAQALSFRDFLHKHWQCFVFQSMSLDVPTSTCPIASRNDFFSRVPAIHSVLNRIDFVGTTDDLSGFMATLSRAFGVPAPPMPYLHRAVDLGASTAQIAALRASYRALAEEPSLTHLVAEERALYQTAKRKAETLQRKYRNLMPWAWFKHLLPVKAYNLEPSHD